MIRSATLAFLCLTAWAAFQQRTSPPQEDDERRADRLLGRLPPDSEYPATLEGCAAKVKEFQAWSEKAYEKYKDLESQDIALQQRFESLQESENSQEVFFSFAGLGLGIAVVVLMVKAIKRQWPLRPRLPSVRPETKQLLILIAGAAWVTAAVLYGVVFSESLADHPVNLFLTVVVYSLPALAFGGIGFWWFGKPEKAPSSKGQGLSGG